MFNIGQLFEPDPMEKVMSSWDLYKGVTEDSMVYVFELVMAYYQIKRKRQIKENNQKFQKLKFSFLYQLLTCTVPSVQPTEILWKRR